MKTQQKKSKTKQKPTPKFDEFRYFETTEGSKVTAHFKTLNKKEMGINLAMCAPNDAFNKKVGRELAKTWSDRGSYLLVIPHPETLEQAKEKIKNFREKVSKNPNDYKEGLHLMKEAFSAQRRLEKISNKLQRQENNKVGPLLNIAKVKKEWAVLSKDGSEVLMEANSLDDIPDDVLSKGALIKIPQSL